MEPRRDDGAIHAGGSGLIEPLVPLRKACSKSEQSEADDALRLELFRGIRIILYVLTRVLKIRVSVVRFRPWPPFFLLL